MLGKSQRLFFSGDSGYFDGFKAIGERYGPFDLAMIEMRGIVKTFENAAGKFTALKGIDLTIQPGEFVSIIGKSRM